MTTFVGQQKRGIGIQELSLAGRTVWGHGGNAIGYGSAMINDTLTKAVIAVLVNDNSQKQLSVAEELLLTLINNPVTGIDNIDKTSKKFGLHQNYPNPFSPNTTIQFSIEKTEYITFVVYNIAGQKVATLVNEEKNAGVHTVNFNTSLLASGIYIYQIKAGSFEQSRKMQLLR